MDIVMPPTFPAAEHRAFLSLSGHFFPELIGNANLWDPLQKRRQFEWSWQAVRYRYRICAESENEFSSLLANSSELWRTGWSDEELTYRVERCIYIFFMSALSVFDSFAFSLYFLGHALRPAQFPDIGNPRKITRKALVKAYTAAFP